MQKTKTHALLIPLMMVMITGCNTQDEQLIQQSIDHQTKQNELIASQSAAAIQQSGQLVDGAKQLVSRDAQARSELISWQKQSQEQLRAEHASIDRQREALDSDRRAIAEEHLHEPIVATTIQGAIELLACLTPLVLATYALRQVGKTNSQSLTLGELLLNELTATQPSWLLSDAEPKRLLR